jgi:hypothetical protein
MLRSNPSFRRLPPAEQQQLLRQLRQVNLLTEEQRRRRLARNEMLERLSPAERTQVKLSAQRWKSLPLKRQELMKNSFRSLRGVPLDQRQTVLNSISYRSTFTPEERAILFDMLRVEPYQPTR